MVIVCFGATYFYKYQNLPKIAVGDISMGIPFWALFSIDIVSFLSTASFFAM